MVIKLVSKSVAVVI